MSKADGEKWVGPVSEVHGGPKTTAQAEAPAESVASPPGNHLCMDKLTCKDMTNEQRGNASSPVP